MIMTGFGFAGEWVVTKVPCQKNRWQQQTLPDGESSYFGNCSRHPGRKRVICGLSVLV
jgi:hypothetical protein